MNTENNFNIPCGFKTIFCRFCAYKGFSCSLIPKTVSADTTIIYVVDDNIVELNVLDDRKLNILSVSAKSEESAYELAMQFFLPGKSAEEIELILAASGF